MQKIVIEIKSCKECPHFRTANQWSSDGWDRMEDWCCTKHPENSMRRMRGGETISTTEQGKLIEGSVEWYEEDGIKIPDWCPIKIDE